MWPMGFISLSSYARKAEEVGQTDKKATKVSRTNIRLSPVSRVQQEPKLRNVKSTFVQKKLDFYENKETEEARRKSDLKSFNQFNQFNQYGRPKLNDPQRFISRSLSIHSDDEDGSIRSQRNIPVFASSSQFEKFFSESDREGSTASGLVDSDAEGILTHLPQSSSLSKDRTLSDVERSIVPKSSPAGPHHVKRVQFSSPAKVSESCPDKSKKISESPKVSFEDDSEGEDMSQKEWYKQVFRVVHKLDNLYANYPIPQVDSNNIPPRPKNKCRKDFGKEAYGSSNKNCRSNSLPSSCKTEHDYLPLQTSYKNSKKLVLVGESPRGSKAGIESTGSKELTILKSDGRSSEERMNKMSDADHDWKNLFKSSKPKIRLIDEQNPENLATALFDFYAHYSNELSFERGDQLNLIRKVDDHWYEAEMNGTKGLVPINYLELNRRHSSSTSKSRESTGLVLKDFQANYPSEISAKKNDVVSIIRHLKGDWLEVSIGSKSGLIPINYVSSHFNQI